MIEFMKKIFILFMSVLCVFSACTEDIVIDNVDESAYDNITTLYGTLRDATTSKVNNIVDLYKTDETRQLVFKLSREPQKGVDVKIDFDSSYLEQYNSEHETDFLLYPEEKLTIQNGGRIVIAPDEKQSYPLEINISSLGASDFQPDKTYIIPLKATSLTEGVSVSEEESHLVYLVRNCSHLSDAGRKPGEKSIFCFLEVNDTNPLNILQWETEDGRLLVDYVVFFAYNINYDKEKGEVYIFPNPNCKFILDHADQFIRPLRERGVKVLMGLLGNHDEAGLAQLSPLGCKQFAKKIAAMCRAYNFDGVNFDDEYAGYPDLDNPLMCQPSYEAAARLALETKKAMPDKLVTLFQFGAMFGRDEVDGIYANEFIDICVADYGGQGVPLKGMTYANCSVASIEFARGGWISVDYARSFAESEYGYVMIFAPWAANNQGSARHFNSLNNLSIGLYKSPLKTPKFYYPKTQSFETLPFNAQ